MARLKSVFDTNDFGLSRGFLAIAKKFSRVDIYIDLKEKNHVPVPEFVHLYTSKTLRSRARKGGVFASLDGKGHTLYLGGRTSQKYLRVYDKGAERKTGEKWTRIELECKGRYASHVGNALWACQSESEFVKVCVGAINDYADFSPLIGWVKDYGVLDAPLTEPESDTDQKRWLRTQVAPFLRKAKQETGNYDLLLYLIRCVDAEELGGLDMAISITE